MQSAIVVLVISFIWFYIGDFLFNLYSWTRCTHSFHSWNSFSLVHELLLLYGCCYPWIYRWIDIILYWCYPYVIPTFHVVIIHRLFFSCLVYGYVLGVPTFHFYHIEVSREECYIRNENLALVKTTLFIGIITTNNRPMKHDHSKTLYIGLSTMYHWRL